MQKRLADLQRSHPNGEREFKKAGIQKMIARLNEELAAYEGSRE
jgi:hypothetical protein